QVGDGGEDALEFDDVLVGRAELGDQVVEPVAEQIAVAAGRERESVLPVVEQKGAVAVTELELAALEDAAILVAEHGQEHLVLKLRRNGIPVYIEVWGVDR